MLPDAVSDPWFKAWKDTHAEHLAAIEEGFAPIPVLKAELASDELVGADRLRPFASDLYREVDPTAILHTAVPLTVTRRDDAHILSLALPCVDPDELEIGRAEDELFVRVGSYRRAIVLPDSLRRRDVASATIRGDYLDVAFADRTRDE